MIYVAITLRSSGVFNVRASCTWHDLQNKGEHMRKLAQNIGKILYRDGPMLVVSLLFVGIFLQNVSISIQF